MASPAPDPDQEEPQSAVDSLLSEEDQQAEPTSAVDSLLSAGEPQAAARRDTANRFREEQQTIPERRRALRRYDPGQSTAQQVAEDALAEEFDLDVPELPEPTRRDREQTEQQDRSVSGRFGLGIQQTQERVDREIQTPEERLEAVDRAIPGVQPTEFERMRERTREAEREYAQSQMSPGERFASSANSFMRGVIGLGEQASRQVAVLAKGLDNLYAETFDEEGFYQGERVEELATYRAAEAIRDFAEEQFPEDERLRGAFLETTLPRALGSGVGFLAGGGAARLLKASSLGFAGTIGALAEGGATYQEAREMGATHEEARDAALKTMPLGALEAIPAERQLGRFFSAFGGNRRAITRAVLAGGAEETAQESIQTVGGNIIARRSFDPDRGITEGLGQASGAGFIVGSLLSGGGAVAGRALGPDPLPEQVTGVRPVGRPQDQVVSVRPIEMDEAGEPQISEDVRERADERRRQDIEETESDRPLKRARRKIADVFYPEGAEQRETLREQADTDFDTGLLNKQGEDRIRERRQPSPDAQEVELEGDVDNFKAINDNLGHDAGDDAIQVIANALRGAVRGQDDVVTISRRGGDEFRVVLELPQGQSSRPAALRIENAVNQALNDAGYGEVAGTEVGFSMGEGEEGLMARKAERGVSMDREERERLEQLAEEGELPESAQESLAQAGTEQEPQESRDVFRAQVQYEDVLNRLGEDQQEQAARPGEGPNDGFHSVQVQGLEDASAEELDQLATRLEEQSEAQLEALDPTEGERGTSELSATGPLADLVYVRQLQAERSGESAAPAATEPTTTQGINPQANTRLGEFVERVPTEQLERFREFAAEDIRAGETARGEIIDSARRHEQLKQRIQMNGIREPLIVEVDTETGRALLIEGNSRLTAAQDLGIEEVPVRVVTTSSGSGRTAREGIEVEGPEPRVDPELRELFEERDREIPERERRIPEHLPPSEAGLGVEAKPLTDEFFNETEQGMAARRIAEIGPRRAEDLAPEQRRLPSRAESLRAEQGRIYERSSQQKRRLGRVTLAQLSEGKVDFEELSPALKRMVTYQKGSVRRFSDNFDVLPDEIYHVTTARTAVEEEGLKSRYELGQQRGKGLGGGTDLAISFTSSQDVAENIAQVMREAHDVATGEITIRDLYDMAIQGTGADRPYDQLAFTGEWPQYDKGSPIPELMRLVMDEGQKIDRLLSPLEPAEYRAENGEGWEPVESMRIGQSDMYKMYHRDATEAELREQRFRIYKRWLGAREEAGGPENPLFFSSDVEGLAETDPSEIAIVRATPANPNAKGLQMGALSEWRTFSGDAVTVQAVSGPVREEDLTTDQRDAVEAVEEAAEDSGGFSAKPSTWIGDEFLPTDVENRGLYHVTTAADQVREEGLKPRSETDREGLGGGITDQAPDKISVTFDAGRAETIRERLTVAVRAARGEMGPREVATYFLDELRITHVEELADALNAPTESFERPADDFLDWVDDQFFATSPTDMDNPYTLVQEIDDAIPTIFDQRLTLGEGPGRIGFTASRESMAEIDPSQIETLRVEGRVGANPDHIADEMELRFNPDDIIVEGRNEQATPGERGELPKEGQPRGTLKSEHVFALQAEDILYQPERMQYKVEGKAARGELLEDVEEWNYQRAGVMGVWWDPDADSPIEGREKGAWVVVNGHNRLQLALDLDVDKVNVIELQAETAEAARQEGALINISEGRGTVFDAAKFFRQQDLSKDDLRALGVPMTEHKVDQGYSISELAQPLFDAYRRQELPVQRAALIGESDLNEAQQIDLWEMIQESGRLRNDEIRAMIRRAKGADVTTSKQETLFGTEQVEQTNLKEQGIIEAYVSRNLARRARTFQFASQEDRAEMLERAGVGEVDPGRAEEIGEQAAQIQEVFEKLATRSGTEINQVIQEEATRLAQEDTDATAVKQRALERATESLQRFVGGGLAASRGGRGAPVEGGRSSTGSAVGAATAGGERGHPVVTPFAGLEERQRAREEIAEGATFRVADTEVALQEELAGEADIGQEDMFGGTGPAEGGDQFGMGLGEGREETMEATEDRAEEIVERLEQTVHEGDPTLEQARQYRDALRVTTQGEGRTDELQFAERLVGNLEAPSDAELQEMANDLDDQMDLMDLPEPLAEQSANKLEELGLDRASDQKRQEIEADLESFFRGGASPGQAGFADVGGGDRGGLVSVELGDRGEEVREALSSGYGKAKGFFNRWFTFASDLPTDVAERNVQRENAIRAEMMSTHQAVRDLVRALRDNGYMGRTGIGGMSEGKVDRLNRALHGEYDAVPEAIRPPIKRMRNHVDRLSEQLIESGMTEGELEMAIRENLGSYLHRSYRIYDDPEGWREEIPPEVYNQAVSFFRREIVEKYPQQVIDEAASLDELAEGRVESYLLNTADSAMSFFAEGKLASKDLSIFKERQEIPSEVRALWGEYRDPRVNYMKSVQKMARLLENHRFLQDVKGMGQDEGWLRSPQQGPVPGVAAQLAPEGSEVYEPLNGWYTTEEIRDAWETMGALQGGVDGLSARWYMKALAIVKGGKTVGSIQTHVRNWVSASSAMIANGNFYVSGTWQSVGKATRASATEVGPMERLYQKLGGEQTEAAREYLLDAVRHGVAHQSARGGEMQAIINDAHLGGDIPMPSDAVLRQTRNAVRSGLRETSNAYQAEDDFWKLLAWEAEQQKIRDVLGENPTQEQLRAYGDQIGFNPSEYTVKEIAASIVRNTVPTYSRVPRAIQALRRSPVFSSFPSFFAEVYRTGFNIMRLTKREMAADIPGVEKSARKNAIRRAAGLLTVGGIFNSIAWMSRFLWDIDERADEDLRWFVPPWSEHSVIAYLGRNAEGHLQWIDLGYSDFYAVFREPVMALLSGRDDWQDRLVEAFDAATDAFTSAEILTQSAIEVWMNTTQRGQRIRNPEASILSQAGSILGHLWKAFEPGTVRSLMRIKAGFEQEVGEGGKDYDPWIELLAMISGQRISPINIPQSQTFNARDLERRQTAARRILNSPLTNRGRVPDEELKDAYREAELSLRDIWAEAHQQAMAVMRRTDLDKDQVARIFAQNGWSQQDAANIVDGVYTPYRPSFQFFQTVAKDLDSDPGAPSDAIPRLEQRFEYVAGLAESLPDKLVWDENEREWVPAQ